MLSDVTEFADPSPQSISYWLAVPSTVVVKVMLVPAPPDVVSATNETDLTKVLFLTLSITSFKISIASVTLVLTLKFV